MASMVGVDGGLGSSTQTLCLNSLHDVSGFCPLLCDSLLRYLARQFGQLLVSLFSQSSFSFVIVVYIMTVILTAELWCL